MKKYLSKAAIAALLVTSTLVAGDAQSLIGFEGGYGSFSYDGTSATSIAGPTYAISEDTTSMSGAVKIGAETDNYRMFVSARMYDVKGLKSAMTYGVALQYKYNFNDTLNIFAGANVGMTEFELKQKTYWGEKINVSSLYLGVDAGVNIHMGDIADLELGARVVHVQDDAEKHFASLEIDNIVSAYGSIIFKFKMD